MTSELNYYVFLIRADFLLREQLSQCIQEQEKLGKVLKEEQKHIQSSHNAKLIQMEMWKNLKQLFDCKLQCIANVKAAENYNFSALS